MTLLLTILWPALAAALLLGGLVGAFAGLPKDRRAVVIVGILVAVAVLLTGLAATGAIAGRAGLWIEIAALCLDAYLIACIAGATLRRRPEISAM